MSKKPTQLREPRTITERMAWAHVDSPIFPIRMKAVAILVNAGIIHSKIYPARVSECLRRTVIADHACKLRKELRARRSVASRPAYVDLGTDATSARMEAQNEGRLMPKRRLNPHD